MAKNDFLHCNKFKRLDTAQIGRGLSSLFLLFMISAAAATQIRIGCIGDSNTDGVMIGGEDHAWPAKLQADLGNSYVAMNFGKSGTTLMRSGDVPYVNCSKFPLVFQSQADIIIINLGTNDTKPQNYIYIASFANDQHQASTFINRQADVSRASSCFQSTANSLAMSQCFLSIAIDPLSTNSGFAFIFPHRSASVGMIPVKILAAR